MLRAACDEVVAFEPEVAQQVGEIVLGGLEAFNARVQAAAVPAVVVEELDGAED